MCHGGMSALCGWVSEAECRQNFHLQNFNSIGRFISTAGPGAFTRVSGDSTIQSWAMTECLFNPCTLGNELGLMNNYNILRTIRPTPDELLAAYEAFGELPTLDALPRLVMVRRAVAAGFFTDNLRPGSPKQTSRRSRQPAERTRGVRRVRRAARTTTSTSSTNSTGAGAGSDGVF
jgi:hypothetical protein